VSRRYVLEIAGLRTGGYNAALVLVSDVRMVGHDWPALEHAQPNVRSQQRRPREDSKFVGRNKRSVLRRRAQSSRRCEGTLEPIAARGCYENGAIRFVLRRTSCAPKEMSPTRGGGALQLTGGWLAPMGVPSQIRVRPETLPSNTFVTTAPVAPEHMKNRRSPRDVIW